PIEPIPDDPTPDPILDEPSDQSDLPGGENNDPLSSPSDEESVALFKSSGSTPAPVTTENQLSQNALEDILEEIDQAVAQVQPLTEQELTAIEQPVQDSDIRRATRALPEMQFAEVLTDPTMWAGIEQMKRDMGEFSDVDPEQELVVQVLSGSTLTLSAGFVAWLLRGGALAATMLSSLPMWKGFDPLPILTTGRKKTDDEPEEAENQPNDENDASVEALFNGAET
ncbi:MAG: hypothetical protein ACR2PS_11920, partial [Pseudomonadales bacterium]